MKKWFVLAITVPLAAASLSMYRPSSLDLLTEEDYRQEQDDSKTPAVTAAPDVDGKIAWKSFNQWQCFPVSQLKFECDPDSEGQETCYPHLIVEQDGSVFDFQFLTPGDNLKSAVVLDRWNSLVANEESFCVYGAYLPDVSDSREAVFSVDRLKTAKGYWDYDSEENWYRPSGLADESSDESNDEVR